MTPLGRQFYEVRPTTTPRVVITGGKEILEVTTIGSIRAKANSEVHVELRNVLLVPKLSASLISLAKALQGGLQCDGKGKRICLYQRS
jgi:hypothetical protein